MKIYFLTVPQKQALKQVLDAEGLYTEDGSYYGNAPVTTTVETEIKNKYGYVERVDVETLTGTVTLDYIGEYQKLAGYDQDGEPRFTPVVGFHVNIYAPDWWELPPALTGYTKRPATPHRLPAGATYVQYPSENTPPPSDPLDRA